MSNNVALALVFIRQNDNRIQLIVSCKWALIYPFQQNADLILKLSFVTNEAVPPVHPPVPRPYACPPPSIRLSRRPSACPPPRPSVRIRTFKFSCNLYFRPFRFGRFGRFVSVVSFRSFRFGRFVSVVSFRSFCFGRFVSVVSFRSFRWFRPFRFGRFVSTFRLLVHALKSITFNYKIINFPTYIYVRYDIIRNISFNLR